MSEKKKSFSTLVDSSSNLFLNDLLYVCSKAYAVAALGVTEDDWKNLGLRALEKFNLNIAKKAFCKVKNYRFLQLVAEIEV